MVPWSAAEDDDMGAMLVRSTGWSPSTSMSASSAELSLLTMEAVSLVTEAVSLVMTDPVLAVSIGLTSAHRSVSCVYGLRPYQPRTSSKVSCALTCSKQPVTQSIDQAINHFILANWLITQQQACKKVAMVQKKEPGEIKDPANY